MGLTRFALTRPVAILMLVAGLVVLGLQSYQRLPVDRLPPQNFPSVGVFINYPGASPADVEQLIAIPMEKAVAGLRGVDTVSSTSSLGSARIQIQFNESTDLDQASIDVEKRINAIRGQLPADAGAPSVTKADFNAFPIMNVAMSGGGRLTTGQLFDLATDQVQPALLQVNGVADVGVSGGRQREVQVQVDPVRLNAFGISLQQIVTSLGAENLNSPSGTLRVGDQQPNVRFTALAQNLDDLKNIVINRGGGAGNAATAPTIYLKDVAEVTDTYAEATRLQRYNGEESIGLSITKQPDANSIAVADAVKATLTRTQRSLPQGVTFKVSNDTTVYTRRALESVQSDLTTAVLITGLVLLLFLHSWRNTLIVLLSIPTSLIATFLVMFFMGFTLNLMSLMALALLIGILVDSSIVILENIHRHLQEGESPMTAPLKAVNEIGMAAMAITFIDVVVYVPIGFMNGNIGTLFKQFGLTIVAATLVSLFISFSLAPMLASRWLKGHGEGKDDEATVAGVTGALFFIAGGVWAGQRLIEPLMPGQTVTVPAWIMSTISAIVTVVAGSASTGNGFQGPAPAPPPTLLPVWGLLSLGLGLLLSPIGWWVLGRPLRYLIHNFPIWWETGFGGIARAYGALLPMALKFRLLVMLIGVGALAGTLAMVKYNVIGSEYSPSSDENQLSVQLRMPPGVSLDATDRVVQRLEAQLSDKSLFPEVKTVFTSVSSTNANIALELVDREDRKRTVWDIQNEVRKLGNTIPEGTLTTQLPSELGGGGGGINIRIVGPDPNVLGQLADQYATLLQHVPGVVEINNNGQAGQPELRATVNRNAQNDLGVTSTTVSQAMRTAIQGSVASVLRVGDQPQENIRVMARRDPSGTPINLAEIPILSSRGLLVRLGQVATITSTTGPAQINRSDRNRSVSVNAAVSGRTIGDVARDVRAAQNTVPTPPGYRINIGGGAQQLDRAVSALSSALSLSILLMYMLLAALYGSFLYPLIVLLSLPLAMVGAFGGLWLTGRTLNIFSLIGIIMLSGVVSKNAILLVDFTNQLRKDGLNAREALAAAGPIRLRPILMTSATLAFAMLPLAMGIGPGGETRAPLAVVMVGGMLTSTLLTLLFVPALYTYFDDLQTLPSQVRAMLARRRAAAAARRAARAKPVEQPVPAPTAPQPALAADVAAGD